MTAEGTPTLGARLRDARLQASMSQADLSERSGIPKPTLSRYENDHVSPSLNTLARLAGALGITESSLLGDKASPMDAFVRALGLHGVAFTSVGEAQRMAADVAAILKRSPRASPA